MKTDIFVFVICYSFICLWLLFAAFPVVARQNDQSNSHNISQTNINAMLY